MDALPRYGPMAEEEKATPWLSTLASLMVGAAFFALWFWLLPPLLGFRVDTARARWRWIAAVPSVLGFAVALRCVWDFGRTGHGTPAPIAPPKSLVISGPYRYVRNPMYVGVEFLIVGEAIFFGSWRLLEYAALVAVGFHLFVVLYEEWALKRKFGTAYEEYCKTVPRWIPSFRRPRSTL